MFSSRSPKRKHRKSRIPESVKAKILLQKLENGFDLRLGVHDDESSPRLPERRRRRRRTIGKSFGVDAVTENEKRKAILVQQRKTSQTIIEMIKRESQKSPSLT